MYSHIPGEILRQTQQKFTPPLAKLLVGGLTLGIAALDLVTPAETDVALFYSAAIVACIWTRSRGFLWGVTLLIGGLTFAAIKLGAPASSGLPVSDIWTNRTITVLALAVIAAQADHSMRSLQKVEERAALIRQLAQIFDLSQALIKTREGNILFWSHGAERLYGWSREEAVGKLSQSLLQTEFSEPVAKVQAALERDQEWRGEVRHVHKDGRPMWAASHWALHRLNGQPPVLLEVNNDITELKRTEQALSESERRFRRLYDSNVVGIVLADSECILEANDYFLHMLGYTRQDFAERKIRWRDVTPPEYLDRSEQAVRNMAETGVSPPFEKEYIRTDGTRVPVLIGSVSVNHAFLSFVIDLTERKRLERQLTQAQKLESIGKLSGGIAHDFNNLLTIIIGQVEMLLMDLTDKDNRYLHSIREIGEAANRAAALTRQLLAFSRRQPSSSKPISLNNTISNVETMLRRLVAEDVELVVELRDDRSDIICADPVHIEQILFNLIVNARDAMPDGGRILIETSVIYVDEQFSQAHIGVTPGRYVTLTITDTGTGMSDEVKAHIFEPFFTTKEPGKGTGLGLATVYGIVKQSGGSIWVYSERGRGTVFRLLFPVSGVQGEEQHTQRVPTETVARGTETILLAEDEPGVRKYVRQILERHGYTVLEAGNGLEALELARNSKPDGIDMLLTDVVMPEMGGDELSRHFRSIHPGRPVLRMSGYTDRIRRQTAERTPEQTAYLQKPFTPADLTVHVRTLLDSSRPS